MKIPKKIYIFSGGGGVGSGGGRVGGCQGGWERRIEAFVKIPKNNFFWGGGGIGSGGGWGASGLGVRVDVNAEVVFVKIQKKN